VAQFFGLGFAKEQSLEGFSSNILINIGFYRCNFSYWRKLCLG
jgi:hypothetical protein